MSSQKPLVLCVDDEPKVSQGIALLLRKNYEVWTASSAQEGLELMNTSNQTFAVVLSDMRMPVMSGAEFLKEVRLKSPDTVRLLLTGYSDIEDAILAVNEGGVFRFLNKSCPPQTLIKTFEEAVQLYQSTVAEKILLEKTLQQSLKAFCHLFALSSPEAYGRAVRIEKLVTDAAQKLELNKWYIPVSAILSQLGWLILAPKDISVSLAGRAPKNILDQVKEALELPRKLFSEIPRLDPVLEMLEAANNNEYIQHNLVQSELSESQPQIPPPESDLELSKQLLCAAIVFDNRMCQGLSPADAMVSLLGYFPEVIVDALSHAVEQSTLPQEGWVPISNLVAGMVLNDDLKASTGALILPSGVELSESLVERLRTMHPTSLPSTVSVRWA